MSGTNSAKMPSKPKYRRVLLKISGDALGNDGQPGIGEAALRNLAAMIAKVAKSGTQLAIVVGGGNIWREADHRSLKIERSTSDQMGMLATLMNALALQSVIEQEGAQSRVQTALPMPQVAEDYIRRRAVRHLEKGRVVLFAAGSGNPYFTTDTAAALRALEIDADVLLKGTKVDGVYATDPKKDSQAKRFATVSYNDVLAKELGVMDETAISLCRENDLPIVVFNILEKDSLSAVLSGRARATTVGR